MDYIKISQKNQILKINQNGPSKNSKTNKKGQDEKYCKFNK